MPGPEDQNPQPTVPTTDEVHVISPMGVLGTIPSSEIDLAQRQGYTVATPEQLEDYRLKKEYGGALRTAEAAGVGALRGLTAGLSDVAATKLAGLIGEDAQTAVAEELRNVREAHPIASGAGEIGGMIGGFLVGTGEAGAAGAATRGALRFGARELVPAAAIAKAGEAAGLGAEALRLGKGIAETHAAIQAAETGYRFSLPSVLTRAAIEGAGYEVGMGMSENALQNRDIIGEELWSAAARGAAMGAGVVGGGRLLGAVVKPTIGGIKRVGKFALGGIEQETAGAVKKKFRSGGLAKLQEMLGSGDAKFNYKLMTDLEAQDRFIYKAAETIDSDSFRLSRELDEVLDQSNKLRQAREGLKDTVIDANIKEYSGGKLPDIPKDFMTSASAQRKYINKLKKINPEYANLDPDTIAIRVVAENGALVQQQSQLVRESIRDIRNKLAQIEPDLQYANGWKKPKGQLEKRIKELEDALASSTTSQDAYRIGDKIKREFGYFTKVAAGGAEKGGKSGDAWRRIHEGLADTYDGLRRGLENEKIWGDLGRFQQNLNGGITESISHQRLFNQNFVTRTGAGEGLDSWFATRRADPGKLKSYITSMQDPSKALPGESLEGWVEGQLQSAQAYLQKVKGLSTTQRKQVRDFIKSLNKFSQELKASKTFAAEKTKFDALTGRAGTGRQVLNALAGGGAATGNVAAIAGAAATMAFDPVFVAKRIHGLASVANFVETKIERGVNNLFTRSTAQYAARKSAYDKKSAELRKEAEKLAQHTPEQAATQTAYKVQTFSPQTPEVTRAAANTAARAQAFLQNAIPGQAVASHVMGPPPGASKTDIEQFERLKKLMTDPTSIMKEIESGKVGPAQVAALRSVFPAQYAKIVQQLNEMLIKNKNKGKDLPYDKRLSIGTVIPGAEPSLDPSYIRTMQGVYNVPPPPAPPAARIPAPQRADSRNTRISLREPREA